MQLLRRKVISAQEGQQKRTARREAQVRGLPVIATIGILLLAKQRSHISTVKEVLDNLIANGTRISQRLYDDALTIAGE